MAHARNKMRDWIEMEWDAQVVAWALPSGDADLIYEVIIDGQYIRADSVPLLIAALNEVRTKRFERLNRPRLQRVA